jgi:hypothetical protein
MHFLLLAATVTAVSSLVACGPTDREPEDSPPMTSRTIEQVLAAHTPELMAIAGVVGTGIGAEGDRPCLIVFVAKREPRLAREIPAAIEGFPVKIEEVGTVRALDEN